MKEVADLQDALGHVRRVDAPVNVVSQSLQLLQHPLQTSMEWGMTLTLTTFSRTSADVNGVGHDYSMQCNKAPTSK